MPQRDSGLIVPLNAMRDSAVQQGPPLAPHVLQINKELKQMDPYLEVVWVGPRANPVDTIGMEPGRWHVRRTPPNDLDSYWPIMGPDKEYAEPTLHLIEEMKAQDLWRKGALQDLRDRQIKAAKKKEKKEALAKEQRIDQAAESYRAVKRVAGAGGLTKRKWLKA